jgi:hypothetical protein
MSRQVPSHANEQDASSKQWNAQPSEQVKSHDALPVQLMLQSPPAQLPVQRASSAQ